MLTIFKMIEYVNLLLLLTMFGSTCYVYYRLKKIFYLISIVMDSEILDQLTDLGRDVDSEFPKPKRGRKNRKNDLILIMTPEKQDKTLELSKHWSVDSTPARNEVITNTKHFLGGAFNVFSGIWHFVLEKKRKKESQP